MASALEIRKKLIDRGAWGCSNDIDSIWNKITSFVTEMVREVLGVLRGQLRNK